MCEEAVASDEGHVMDEQTEMRHAASVGEPVIDELTVMKQSTVTAPVARDERHEIDEKTVTDEQTVMDEQTLMDEGPVTAPVARNE